MSDQTPKLSAGSPFLPLLIALIALAVLVLSQTFSLIRDRGILAAAHDGQNTAFGESERMRQQLEILAGKTAELARKGDADAKGIVAEFAKRGVNIVPPGEPAPSGAATPKP
jgi:hypothetical protein